MFCLWLCRISVYGQQKARQGLQYSFTDLFTDCHFYWYLLENEKWLRNPMWMLAHSGQRNSCTHTLVCCRRSWRQSSMLLNMETSTCTGSAESGSNAWYKDPSSNISFNFCQLSPSWMKEYTVTQSRCIPDTHPSRKKCCQTSLSIYYVGWEGWMLIQMWCEDLLNNELYMYLWTYQTVVSIKLCVYLWKQLPQCKLFELIIGNLKIVRLNYWSKSI